MRKFRALAIVGANFLDLGIPSFGYIRSRAVLAFTKMAVCHHRMFVELRQRFLDATLEAGFHCSILC